MSIKSGIYKIINRGDGHCYVGSAVNLTKRKCNHWQELRNGTHRNIHLQRAWNKYGEEMFHFQVVGKCSTERLLELEQEVMDHLKPEYNIEKTAQSSLGVRRRAETLAKMSAANIGKHLSPKTRTKMSKARMGHLVSQETKSRISCALIGRKHPQWRIDKNRYSHLGKKRGPHSIETRKKMSLSAEGRIPSAETRIRMGIAQKARQKRELEQRHELHLGS